jgi:desulfoferrodoxin (superoxide reductase-like protein)
MNRRGFILTSAAFLAGLLVPGRAAWANKSEVKIEVPETAAKGAEISILVTVTHSANSALHYTDWLWVQVNGKEVARWNYSSGNLPEGATFTKEVRHKVDGNLEIKARANCNNHGSAGEATVKVTLKG